MSLNSDLQKEVSILQANKKGVKAKFERFAEAVTRAVGTPVAFFVALLVVVVWGITGPIFRWSDTWQLVINTGTTIVTFLMVFLIQQSQNKDSLALQLKLNELIACEERASNRLIDVEDLSQEELDVLKKFYVKLAVLAKEGDDLHTSHSVDDATDVNHAKHSYHEKRRQERLERKKQHEQTNGSSKQLNP
ncbi:low affinity iron permease family protein [Flaviaesturariibacter aridisoli]|uniref:Low affinity iron permease family protein n=1 Tax=Flaviaesturariibacter aridisoli TaxID=2545761 RepID=A0A4R4E2H3_9BACT|nr:low affinity iron permease family protein [Flaviaesturariibacter aridisoli]TCZ69595.1 low affinity iron permease family protein [Flaviaesturariibacter aridisoli]